MQVDANHEHRKLAEFYIFDNLHQCTAKMLYIKSMECLGDSGTCLPLNISSFLERAAICYLLAIVLFMAV